MQEVPTFREDPKRRIQCWNESSWVGEDKGAVIDGNCGGLCAGEDKAREKEEVIIGVKGAGDNLAFSFEAVTFIGKLLLLHVFLTLDCSERCRTGWC